MTVDGKELLEAAKIVAKQEGVQACVKHSLGASAFTFATTFVGGLLMGPVGIAAGAIIGGGSSMVYSKNKFKSLVSIIDEDMTELQKQALIEHLKKAFENFDVHDLESILLFLCTRENVYAHFLKILLGYVANNLNMNVTSIPSTQGLRPQNHKKLSFN